MDGTLVITEKKAANCELLNKHQVIATDGFMVFYEIVHNAVSHQMRILNLVPLHAKQDHDQFRYARLVETLDEMASAANCREIVIKLMQLENAAGPTGKYDSLGIIGVTKRLFHTMGIMIITTAAGKAHEAKAWPAFHKIGEAQPK